MHIGHHISAHSFTMKSVWQVSVQGAVQWHLKAFSTAELTLQQSRHTTEQKQSSGPEQ